MFLFIILHHGNWDRSYEWSMLKNHRPISHKMGSFLRQAFFLLVNIVNNKSYNYISATYIQVNVYEISDHNFNSESCIFIWTQ